MNGEWMENRVFSVFQVDLGKEDENVVITLIAAFLTMQSNISIQRLQQMRILMYLRLVCLRRSFKSFLQRPQELSRRLPSYYDWE
jgi:hypothetical protein